MWLKINSKSQANMHLIYDLCNLIKIYCIISVGKDSHYGNINLILKKDTLFV